MLFRNHALTDDRSCQINLKFLSINHTILIGIHAAIAITDESGLTDHARLKVRRALQTSDHCPDLPSLDFSWIKAAILIDINLNLKVPPPSQQAAGFVVRCCQRLNQNIHLRCLTR